MKAMQEKLYLELRETEEELINGLMKRESNDWLTSFLKEELFDVRAAIAKIQKGNFGECEISGELLPEELLKILPTLKSEKDFHQIGSFYKKPYESMFFYR
ncbi:hypothetical protein RCG23_04600 [Neobacillus sp. PS3-34]|uniref:hypothetical protein n=1 Tax=Neobacillus sp. PS3-34 TaxID=3070678 RepID=UPI0027E1CE23|nr:hypothetical protein [Neobacillus sp. PS3-34]WML49329.1 hypothetical protein RCG23_04600 [Neobacillus sp. PS3-34]